MKRTFKGVRGAGGRRSLDANGMCRRGWSAAAGLAVALVLSACVARRGEAGNPPAAAPALRLGGQRVLVLPVQMATGLSGQLHARATAELLFALGEREPRATWVAPAELERSLRRSPAFAGDPRLLPADPLLHHGERRAADPLASELRRYAALTDVRLVFLPQELRFTPTEGAAGTLHFSAALLDARTGEVLWWGSSKSTAAAADSRALADAAASLAERLLALAGGEARL